MSAFVGIVCGLRVEADCLPRNWPAIEIAISGASAARAEDLAENLVWKGAHALFSFGLSGALLAGLAPGDLLISSGVVDSDGSYRPADAVLLKTALASARKAGVDVRPASLVGSDRLIETPQAKAKLGRRTATDAVDMESHAVARVAAAHDRPFLAIRAIADTADSIMPESARDAVDASGEPRPLAVLAGLVRKPADFGPLMTLASDARKGQAALRTAARLVLPDLVDHAINPG